MTLPWIIAAATAGLLAGPRIRATVFARSTEDGLPRRVCPECSRQVLAGRWRWCSVLPVTGRCPHCKARIGPDALAAEVITGLVLAGVAARASSGWELAALAWLALIAVPLAFIGLAVQRLPDLLTVSAFAGTLVLLGAPRGRARAARASCAMASLTCSAVSTSPGSRVAITLASASSNRVPGGMLEMTPRIRSRTAGSSTARSSPARDRQPLCQRAVDRGAPPGRS